MSTVGTAGDQGAPAAAQPGLLELLRADYAVIDELEGRQWGRTVLAPIRFLIQPSFRAVLLFRLSARAGMSYTFWRSLLTALHSCEVTRGATIGPGLRLPHPFGIAIGQTVVIGRNVTLAHNVTLGGDTDMLAQPTLHDRVTVYPGAVVAGSVTIGEGATIGPNCVIQRDVAPGAFAVLAGTRILAAAPGAEAPKEDDDS